MTSVSPGPCRSPGDRRRIQAVVVLHNRPRAAPSRDGEHGLTSSGPPAALASSLNQDARALRGLGLGFRNARPRRLGGLLLRGRLASGTAAVPPGSVIDSCPACMLDESATARRAATSAGVEPTCVYSGFDDGLGLPGDSSVRSGCRAGPGRQIARRQLLP